MGAGLFTCHSRPEELNKELHYAARHGIYTWINDLMKEGADVNALNKHGETPLMAATFHENIPIMEMLIDYGGDVNARIDINSETALNYAARQNCGKAMELLINKGADVNARDQHGDTPLMVAAFYGNIPIMEMLLDNRSDVNARNEENRKTALHYAAGKYSLKATALLIDKGADVNVQNQHGKTPLMTAIFSETLQIVELLMDNGADIGPYDNLNSETALNYAAKQSSGKTLRLLIEKGVDVNLKVKYTALMTAAWYGHVNNVLTLIEAGADLNIEIHGHDCLTTAFRLLLLSGHYQYAKILIEAGADVNVPLRKGISSSLSYAAQRGDMECAKLLLNAGAAVNVRQEDEHTALEFCLERYKRISGKQEEEFILMLFAAGEKVHRVQGIFEPSELLPEFLVRMSQRSLRLTDMCRDTIRKHLIELNNVNLFVRVRQLGLAASLESFLVHNVSLDQ